LKFPNLVRTKKSLYVQKVDRVG